MAKNIWDAQQQLNNNIDRDFFDWSHINHFTAKFGYLYPVMRSLVPANTKCNIKADAGLQFLPMSFPVQTPMRARFSFFKIPLRTLWKDYMDYVGNFKQGLEEPYHDFNNSTDFDNFFGKCQLGDYLDIPNVVYNGDFGLSPTLTLPVGQNDYLPYIFIDGDGNIIDTPTGNQNPQLLPLTPGNSYVINDFVGTQVYTQRFGRLYNISSKFQPGVKYTLDSEILSTFQYRYTDHSFSFSGLDASGFTRVQPVVMLYFLDNDNNLVLSKNISEQYNNLSGTYTAAADMYILGYDDTTNLPYFQFDLVQEEKLQQISKVFIGYTLPLPIRFFPAKDVTKIVTSLESFNQLNSAVLPSPVIAEVPGQEGQYSYVTPSTTPYYSTAYNETGLKLKSYSARAYEAVYNAYYRDPRNNPLIDDNGQPVYNDWLLNKDGGADEYPYKLHRVNWEKDFLTTAVQSPQQGIAPLVGLTQYLQETPSDDGSNLSYGIALIDEDNKKYKVNFKTSSNGEVQGYSIVVDDILPDTTPVASIDYNQMLQAVNYGIAIPDFRAVNAYQHYLELNIRKGYSYKDIIEGRFDCKVRFDELQMPEFLGGFTRDINMNRVIQSVDNNTPSSTSYEKSLGALAGDAFLSTRGTDTPNISFFADEECIILGLMSIVPTPAYSQLLPKDYLYNDILDHFNPEFNNLGMQPISYAEVCPLQLKQFGVSPDDTFGYQRAWYEYCSKPDTVHGLMRAQFRDFILNRNFYQVPRLNQSFLLVDDKQLNDVFQVQDDEDKIVGQVYYNIDIQLPINRVQIPRID